MIATLRYEFLMQVRRPVLWIVYGLAFAALVSLLRQGYVVPTPGSGDPDDPRPAMIAVSETVVALMPAVYGCLLADRLIRDRRLGVAGVLDSTPAGHTGRLIGKYLGVCAATALPIALIHLGRAVAFAVAEGRPAALGWALLLLVVKIVPALLFVGALALAGPLLVPPLLFRVLFVGYWFWGNLIPANMMPTISHTVFSANARYVEYGLFGDPYAAPGVDAIPYGPQDGAALNFLRPLTSPAVAVLWIGVMLAMAAAVLLLARLHAIRTES
ncbi:hypothetical protein OG589_24155 [Sphaerisporangium sp. NBC_01403]|uniref:hypothetical protein n=1 Tax=Sphaerisporangium sp. NBC_01403 TaxID=2903599 RepID=UPI0032442EBC